MNIFFLASCVFFSGALLAYVCLDVSHTLADFLLEYKKKTKTHLDLMTVQIEFLDKKVEKLYQTESVKPHPTKDAWRHTSVR